MADNFNILDTPSGIFTESYDSGELTITSNGSATLNHELSGTPTLIEAFLICKIVDLGYFVGERVKINPNTNTTTANRGIMTIPKSTQITLRYGSDANAISILNRDIGNIGNITNTSWKLIIQAYI